MAITTDTIEVSTPPTRPEPRMPDDTSLVRDQGLAGLVWALALGAGRVPLFP